MTGKRTPPTMTHDEMVAKWMEDPAFKAEYDAMELDDAFFKHADLFDGNMLIRRGQPISDDSSESKS